MAISARIGAQLQKMGNPMSMAPQPQAAPGSITIDTTGNQPITVPGYHSVYDPNTMSMADYLKGQWDTSGMAKFKQDAMRSTPSAWAQLAKQDQDTQAGLQREKGLSENNSATAQSMDQLASSGGLSSGARERAAIGGAKNAVSMSQGIAQQDNLNKMQIGMNDEQNRIQELSQLPGMEQSAATTWANAKNQDVQNAINENNNRNTYNMNIAQLQSQATAAGKQATATENSGKK